MAGRAGRADQADPVDQADRVGQADRAAQASSAAPADQAGPAASAETETETEAEEASLFGLAPVSPDRVAAYGDHRDQVVDFYLPEAETAAAGAAGAPAPLVLLFHGGAWRAPYDRRHLSPFAAYLAGRGFVVASVEYRRGGPDGGDGSPPRAGRWPETLDDIAAAVDTVPGLARGLALPVDLARVVLVGHSAGGHAALWAAARHVLPPDCPWHLPSPPPVCGVVALAPIADFTTARELRVCSDAVSQFLDLDIPGNQAHHQDRLPLADPAALLPTAVPTAIVQGATDIDVPPQVAYAFTETARRAGQPVRAVRLASTGHFPLIDPTAAAVRTVADEIAHVARNTRNTRR
ncbi:alpha/beta hydrolase [Streptomyces sp. NBS 14/10]|uniref:alpha/beta hydrolase family protein n=1 Tax=Streptomyces sp. NBS 14/10 TaxID=1945643 RepID=UPI00211AA545|nr:alpha/beta hydrolase [Streptomyces sp. NBS 14/10]KAK1180504.1 alpha/beta hydrolase [Streptomyces sp. NBS 14/10]